MESSQKEKGFTQISNELIEAFQRLHLSGNQWQVLWAIIRKTNGWHKSVEFISLSVFEKCTGIDRRNLKRSLDIMVKRKIITKSRLGYITKYGIQKDHTRWHTSVNNDTSIITNTSVKPNTTTSVNNDTETSVKTDTHKRKNKIKYNKNSDEFRLANQLLELLLKKNPMHDKPDLQELASCVDEMIRLDNREVSDIEAVVGWCQSSDAEETGFWNSNVICTEKLRAEFDQLLLKVKASRPSKREETRRIFAEDKQKYLSKAKT